MRVCSTLLVAAIVVSVLTPAHGRLLGGALGV
jgi:hypothetical protein